MVLEAILTGKQPHEKLQCLYVSGNLMSNNFRKTAVLPKKKTGIVNSTFTTKFCISKLWGSHLYLNFSGRLL